MTDPAPDAAVEPDRAILRLEVPIASPRELRALRGALLAARATELSEIQRRAGRLNLGYGSDTSRESMSDEVATLRQRWEMLDRLIASIDAASPGDHG
ncbi:MAG: hypothetical protein H0V73_12300 [Chloroflexi bacterium]|nr:hypothetical protein [Chloroflexota bacterium]